MRCSSRAKIPCLAFLADAGEPEPGSLSGWHASGGEVPEGMQRGPQGAHRAWQGSLVERAVGSAAEWYDQTPGPLWSISGEMKGTLGSNK